MPAGRPTKYDPNINEQVTKLCKLGATDEELADFFNVAVSTISLWKVEHDEFSEAIRAGKEVADSEVAQSLFKSATGYSHEDVDIKMYEGSIIETKLIKHYPPNPTSIIFWLKNRQSAKWRDKTEVDAKVTGDITYTGIELVKPDAEDNSKV